MVCCRFAFCCGEINRFTFNMASRAFLSVTEVPLLGLVTKVKISFNPFDPRSVRARCVDRFCLVFLYRPTTDHFFFYTCCATLSCIFMCGLNPQDCAFAPD